MEEENILVCPIIWIPIWKALTDFPNLTSGYGMRPLLTKCGMDGFISIFTNRLLLQPLWVSIYTTVAATFRGLLLSAMGSYGLIQWDMPDRTLLANILLFTMTFSGSIFPTARLCVLNIWPTILWD